VVDAREVARNFALRIRTQAILLGLVPLVFLIALVAIAATLQNKTDQTAAWSQRSTNALNQSDRIARSLTAANRSVADYTTKNLPTSALADYRTAQRELPAQANALRQLVRDEPGQEKRAVRLGHAADGIMSILAEYLADRQAGRKAKAQALIESARTRAVVNEWQAAKNDFDQAERAVTIDRFKALQHEFGQLMTVLLACSVAGILLTFFITARFGLRIARRLRRLADNAGRIGSGEPTESIGGGDEIADLDEVYHEMARRIHETLHQKDEALAAYERAHHVASTLQRALLPQELPRVTGVQFDGVYEPGRSEALIGGDWYDALRLADGRVLISIGDVAGSGLQAAVIMAAMRQVIRGVAQLYADPATIVDAADRTLKAEHPNQLVTAFVGVFDPVARTLSYCSAGHPDPLFRLADGTVSELPSRGLPLGLRARGDTDPRTATVPEGATMVFFTDGLIESTRDVVEGERRVREVLAAPSIMERPNVAEALYEGVLHDGANDDVAILVMRVDPSRAGASTEALGQFFHRWTLDTHDAATAQRSRGAFAALLGEGGMFDEDVFSAELIFGELLSNAVRYAPGTIEIVLDWSGAPATLHFLDRGPGFELIPRLPTDLLSERGRGLFLVWSMAEDFNVTKRPDGGSHARVVLSPRRRTGGRDRASAARPVPTPANGPP
jgi:serine phosphatase RsbU (regulator of sigma subunit)/CHASE3 domain sensor protein/anti-sigma regulatory factor (Ser/Thr protein kinase)